MDFKPFYSSLSRRIIAAKLSTEAQIRPMRPDQIQRIADRAGRRLPAAYACFLQKMGNGAGGFMDGSDVFGPVLLDVREVARQILGQNEGGASGLADTQLVVGVHGGCLVWMLDLRSGGEDPPVLEYGEGDDEPLQVAEHFTEFLQAYVELYEAALRS